MSGRAFDEEWKFVLDFYAREGVASACLLLQDEFDLDVTVLLHAIWMHCREGQTPSAEFIRALDESIRPWRTQATEPLRQARRRLKAALPLASAADGLLLYQQVANAELLAERISLSMLHAVPFAAAQGCHHEEPVARVVATLGDVHRKALPSAQCSQAISSLAVAVQACRRASGRGRVED